jgi:glycosyltransferase involved in cell wall biosynthesis
MKKIKILHIQESIAHGGVERRRLSLAKHLNKEVFDQKFICTHAIGNIPEEIRAEGFEVIAIGDLKSSFDWKQHKKIQKLIDDFQPDIIHGAVFEGVTMATINGFIKKVPIIIIEETSDPQNRTWRGNFLMKFFSGISDVVIGVSQSVTDEYLIGKLGIKKEKVKLINNGVAIPRKVSDEEIKAAKIKWNINETDFVVGSVGRMRNDSHKRYSDLIKAFAKFSEGKHNCKLLMVGGNENFLKKYRDLAEKLKISDKIIFTGYQQDTALFYKMMDVFSLVSAREAFGLVLAEAMLFKLPVVATKVGGMKYIVDDGKTGFLVEPGNIEEILSKFETLFQNKDMTRNFGENGYNKALREYTEQMYIEKISNLYLSLAENSK